MTGPQINRAPRIGGDVVLARYFIAEVLDYDGEPDGPPITASMLGVVSEVTDEVAALRAERDAAIISEGCAIADREKAEAERDAMRPVVEAAGHLLTVVEWLDDDSDRTEDWKQAYWDLRVAMEAHDGE